MMSSIHSSSGGGGGGDQQSTSSHSYEESGLPFFADMTLDLAEAHDIAETPEPTRRTMVDTTTTTTTTNNK